MPWHRILLNESQLAQAELDSLVHQLHGLLDCADHDGVAVFTAAHRGGGVDCYFSPAASSLARCLIDHYHGCPCSAPTLQDLHTLVGQKGSRERLLGHRSSGVH